MNDRKLNIFVLFAGVLLVLMGLVPKALAQDKTPQ